MSFFVYIIYSRQLNKFYVGYTGNVLIRLQQHNAGLSSFTAKANDWVIVYSESFTTRENAMKRERDIKKKKSRKYIESLIQNK
jgi:putative endonuclease